MKTSFRLTLLYYFLFTQFAAAQKISKKDYSGLNMSLTAPKNYSFLNENERNTFQQSKNSRPFALDVLKKEGSDQYIQVMRTGNDRSLGSLYPDQTDYYSRDNKVLLSISMLLFDTVNNVISIPKKLLKSINADTALIRLATDSSSKSMGTSTRRFLYVTIVKNDLGAIWLAYNYEAGKLKQAIKEVYDTWGLIKFRPDQEMKRDKADSTTIYFGKFKYLNTPEILKKDSAALTKLLKRDPYLLEDRLMYANTQYYMRNYQQSINISEAAITRYTLLKNNDETPIKNEKNTVRQIANFYYLKGLALDQLSDKPNARISYQKAKEMGHQLHPEALKLLE